MNNNGTFNLILESNFSLHSVLPPLLYVGRGKRISQKLLLGLMTIFALRGGGAHFEGSICLGGTSDFSSTLLFL